ncbi:MAG: hypothetical protein ACI4R9_05110 [Kiritimatiellia bacterium]
MRKPDATLLLTTVAAVSLAADAAKLPRRIKILNWGENPNCHGKRVNVGPLFVRNLRGRGRVPDDVEMDERGRVDGRQLHGRLGGRDDRRGGQPSGVLRVIGFFYRQRWRFPITL